MVTGRSGLAWHHMLYYASIFFGCILRLQYCNNLFIVTFLQLLNFRNTCNGSGLKITLSRPGHTRKKGHRSFGASLNNPFKMPIGIL